MPYEIRRSIAVALLASFTMVGCNSEKGVGVATSAEAEAAAKAAPEENTNAQQSRAGKPKIQAEGSASSLKVE